MGTPIRHLCALGAAGLLAACGGNAPQVQESPPTEMTYFEVRMDNALREACRDFEMPDPKFKVDSATLDAGSKVMLAGFAACLNGPMKPVQVRLVGQADPRGTKEYNLELGLERAQAVRDVLVEHGVASERVLVASIGEGDAGKGRPWYDDRKVSVGTAGGMSPPDADDYSVTQVTIYGEGPEGGVLVFEEREDIDGDGADEPALYFKAKTGERTRVPGFREAGDVDGDGADEPAAGG